MGSILSQLSALSTPVIALAAVVHLFVFLWLWNWHRRDLRHVAGALDEFTRELKHRSVLDPNSHLADQVNAFVADIAEVLDTPGREAERAILLSRLRILDERRAYLQSLRFETLYNACRTMIEAYPLAGVLGTILAIGVVLQTGDSADPSVQALVTRFGEAIWSTFAGLVAAIILMFINSLVDPAFTRLIEARQHVRDLVARAKRLLSLTAPAAATDGPPQVARP